MAIAVCGANQLTTSSSVRFIPILQRARAGDFHLLQLIRVSSFLRFEFFARTSNAVGFL
jgi:hypothetical protein